MQIPLEKVREFAKEQGGICILTLQRPSELVLSRSTNNSRAERDGKQAIRTKGTHTLTQSQLQLTAQARLRRKRSTEFRKTGKASLSQLPVRQQWNSIVAHNCSQQIGIASFWTAQ